MSSFSMLKYTIKYINQYKMQCLYSIEELASRMQAECILCWPHIDSQCWYPVDELSAVLLQCYPKIVNIYLKMGIFGNTHMICVWRVRSLKGLITHDATTIFFREQLMNAQCILFKIMRTGILQCPLLHHLHLALIYPTQTLHRGRS